MAENLNDSGFGSPSQEDITNKNRGEREAGKNVTHNCQTPSHHECSPTSDIPPDYDQTDDKSEDNYDPIAPRYVAIKGKMVFHISIHIPMLVQEP